MRKSLARNIAKPSIGLAMAPAIFAFSQIIILGYYWIFEGYFGNLSLTISRYVGLELWSSIFFCVCNFFIATLLLRYFISVRKKFSAIWFVLSLIEVIGFVGLSVFPHIEFGEPGIREIFVNTHIFFARTMFIAMFCMGLERFRLATRRDNFSMTATLAFIAYGLVYITGYSIKWPALWNTMLIWETGYIYVFMAMLVLTRRKGLPLNKH